MCPWQRSKISNIQLLLLVKYESVVEFGIDTVLQPIIEDIRKLESVSTSPFIVSTHLCVYIYTFCTRMMVSLLLSREKLLVSVEL